MRGLHALDEHQLLRNEYLKSGRFPEALCPMDGTPVPVPEGGRETKVRCPTCGYEFLASAEPPVLTNGFKPHAPGPGATPAGDESAAPANLTGVSGALRNQQVGGPKISGGGLLLTGLFTLAGSWLPLLCYVLWAMFSEFEPVHAPLLGHLALAGSAIGILLAIAGGIKLLANASRLKKSVNPIPAAPPPTET
jgi:hypothetical protein